MINKGITYFKDLKNIGDLKLDYIFEEFETEPMVFTCTDNKNNLYLCVLYEVRYSMKWIVSKLDIKTLKKLLSKQIDIFDAIHTNVMVHKVVTDTSGKTENWFMATQILNPLDQPSTGVYLRIEKEEAKRYLKERKAVCKDINKRKVHEF